jgi:hypothetical protein
MPSCAWRLPPPSLLRLTWLSCRAAAATAGLLKPSLLKATTSTCSCCGVKRPWWSGM